MQSFGTRAFGVLGVAAVAVVPTVWIAACSAAGSGTGGSPGPSGRGGYGGAVFGGTGSNGNFGGGFGTGSVGGGILGDAACAGEVHAGERVPLDMYFLVDTSGSMNEKVQGGTKWQVVSSALVSFLNDPTNADIGVGIDYFPALAANAPSSCTDTTNSSDCKNQYGDFGPCTAALPGLGCSFFGLPLCFCQGSDSCQVSAYAAPSVPLALPPNHAAVVADLGQHGPGGGTPTRPAVEGSLQYAASWANQHPGRTTVFVLATDGDPTGCTTNTPQDVANVVAQALNGPNHIKTFVIGVGSSLTSLNLVAQSGGSGQAYLVDTGANVGQAFTQALLAIRGQAVPCDFVIPIQTDQGTVDPHLVNVFYTPQNGPPRAVAPTQDGTGQTCGPQGGWYYDDPNAPKTIKLCDATCQAVTQSGSVSVQLGCQTIPPVVQ
jgi:hypothetical protein